MYARVATFEGMQNVDEAIEEVRGDVDQNRRPPGLEDAKGMVMGVDRESGKSIGIIFFDTEEALKRGDEALNAMSPADSEGRRTSVQFYEIPVSVFPSS